MTRFEELRRELAVLAYQLAVHKERLAAQRAKVERLEAQFNSTQNDLLEEYRKHLPKGVE